jgi:hyperosmotically inducible periplasmic protein
MKARLFPVLAMIAFLGASPAWAAQDRRDTQLADKVASAIGSYPSFTIFDDIGGSVEQGVVTLTGKVTMPYKKSDVEKRIARIDGVKSVNNRIDVLPVSIYDDELRASIARAIYRNPSFWNYAMMSNPPIHIVVENGRVTLTGVVSSPVDKALAQALASGNGEFRLTNALRTEM